MVTDFTRALAQTSTTEERMTAMAEHLQAQPSLNEADLRLELMRCRVCGHEYGAYGCDADIRRCPQCQDGLPGLPVMD